MDRLRFGISGLPLGQGGRKFTYATGIAYLAQIGLDAMELPFVRSVNVTAKNCEAVRAAGAAHDVALSAHGSYYVNLNGDAAIRAKSLERIRAAAAGIRLAGGRRVVFHPGFYLGGDRAAAAAAIAACLDDLAGEDAEFCLETTGKPTQFGTAEEIAALCQGRPNCRVCIDFAHIHARGNGALRRYDDFAAILQLVWRELGRAALDDLHMHVSGIEYTARGERRHLPLLEGDLDYMALLKALRDFGARGRLIVESPLLERDALILKTAYHSL